MKQISIIGTGMIGTSLGMAIKESFGDRVKIRGYDLNSGEVEAALKMGGIDSPCISVEQAAKSADMVFIAADLSAITGIIEDLSGLIKAECIVTDVGSVKGKVCLAARAHVAKSGLRFVGGHPMAGSEQGGAHAASASLFRGAFYILTPIEEVDAYAVDEVKSLLNKLGARTAIMSVEMHDAVVASLSHLPHMISASLMESAIEMSEKYSGALNFAATGFKDMTRIAASSPSMWSEILVTNSEAVLESLEAFESQISMIRELIETRNKSKIEEMLESAASCRKSIKTLRDEMPLILLKVDIADRPGELNSVTSLLGERGINIDDIEIKHNEEIGKGTLYLYMKGEDKAKSALSILKSGGYPASS